MPLLPKRKNIGKAEKLAANLHDETEYVKHIRNLKQALNHSLVLKNFHRVIKLNQNAWLQPYIDMKTGLRKKAKNDFEKDSFKLMNNTISEKKTVENIKKHRDIKLVTTERRRNYLVPEPNYHTTKLFTENLLAIEMKRKPEIFMNKLVHLGVLILELSEILMYEFWYDYLNLKYGEKLKLCYIDTDSFILYIKTEDIYKHSRRC